MLTKSKSEKSFTSEHQRLQERISGILDNVFSKHKKKYFLLSFFVKDKDYFYSMKNKARLMATTFFFLLLFNYPLLQIIDFNRQLGGMPILYIYLFFVWIVMIVVLYYLASKKLDEHE